MKTFVDIKDKCEKVWSRPYNYTVIDKSKNRYDCDKLRTNWDWRALYLSLSIIMSISLNLSLSISLSISL